jgi:TPR repeat protein
MLGFLIKTAIALMVSSTLALAQPATSADDAFGVAPDRAEAIRWFRKAAEKGDEDAIQALKLLGAK